MTYSVRLCCLRSARPSDSPRQRLAEDGHPHEWGESRYYSDLFYYTCAFSTFEQSFPVLLGLTNLLSCLLSQKFTAQGDSKLAGCGLAVDFSC